MAESGPSGQIPSLRPKEVKLERPSNFTGLSTHLSTFIFEMRMYLQTVGLGTGETACRFMAQFFKKDALDWWRSVYEDNPLIFSVLTLDQLCAMVER